jgi:metal-responsive CopG/Arc/MetJ family transcriptional regulator
MRTIIELPPAQLEALDAVCRRDGISRAEAIRRAIAASLGETTASGRKAAFGLWRGRRTADGLAYERRLRREWR